MDTFVIHREGFLPDFKIQTDCEVLSVCLRRVYRPFLRDKPVSSLCAEISFETKGATGEGLCCYTLPGQEERKFPLAPRFALQEVENLLYEVSRLERGFVALHCGAVGKNGKAYLLAGSTGAGKSTLTGYLCTKGYQYLSDDVALFSLEDGLLRPHPRPLQLREGGAAVLRQVLEEMPSTERHAYGELFREILHFPMPSQESYEVGGVYFLRRLTDLPEEKEGKRLLTKSEAFLRVLRTQFCPGGIGEAQYALWRSLLSAGAWELSYRELSFALEQIGEGS